MATDDHRGNFSSSGHLGNDSHSDTHEGHGGSHEGHGGISPELAKLFATRLKLNEAMAKNYAAAICGLIALFIFLHWTRRLVSRSSGFPVGISRPFVVVSRRVRNLLVRGAPGLTSSGHGLLVVVYVVINIVLLFTNVHAKNSSDYASRFGWLTVMNLCFLVFLAMKNTPLAYLTPYSYERLNCLHQIAGCTTFLLMFVHAVVYTAFFYNIKKVEVLKEDAQTAGIIAGFMFLVMVTSALLLRRYAYEVFYVMHVTAFCAAIISIGFHRPEIKTKIPVVICLTAAIFIADHLLRLTRLLINFTNNEATIYPLPNGGTRILLAKRPCRAMPGKHVFMWIPRIRPFELHPFTIIDSDGSDGPTEFVVKSYNGFTRKLHAYASAHPGAKVSAGAEGPYGTFPDPMEYDKIILIAGGSGATYTFGLAVNMLERMDAQSTKNIVFIWTAKTQQTLSWFSEHLNTLRTHLNAPKVHVSLHVTRAPGSSSSSDEDMANTGSNTQSKPAVAQSESGVLATKTAVAIDCDKDIIVEKEHVEDKGTTSRRNSDGSNVGNVSTAVASKNTAPADAEKAAAAAADGAGVVGDSDASESLPLRHSVASGRIDTETVIRDAVSSTAGTQRVLVAACGPPALMRAVRDATAKCITSNGPSIELHCEQFSW